VYAALAGEQADDGQISSKHATISDKGTETNSQRMTGKRSGPTGGNATVDHHAVLPTRMSPDSQVIEESTRPSPPIMPIA